MAGFFTFLYLRKLRLRFVASFIGGITFMFCGFLTAHKTHHTMLMAASYLPVVLYFFESFLISHKVSRLFLTALAFGLSILADYTAVPMYIGMVLLPYILFRVFTDEEYKGKPVRKKWIDITWISFVIFGAGIMIAAIQVLPILESLRYVTREKIPYSFFASYSFDYKLLPLLIFPYFFGTQYASFYQPAYFGPWNLTELMGYMGILPILFAVLSFILFRSKNLQIYFWTGIALAAFILVLGDYTPLYHLMYRIPIYNMFRVSARNWLEVNFAVTILSSFSIHYLITDTSLTRQRYFSAISKVIILLFAAIILILVSVKNWNFPSEMKQRLLENIHITSSAIYIPLILVALSTILLYFLYRYRESSTIWIIAAFLIFFDLFSFGHFHEKLSYFKYRVFQGQSNETADFLSASSEDKNHYRIFTISATNDVEKALMPNINLLYGFQVVNAYSPIWLKDYNDLTTFEASGNSLKSDQLLLNQKILSLLSTKYIIATNEADNRFLQTIPAKIDPNLSKTIVEGFIEKKWEFLSSNETKNEIIKLQSDSPGQVSWVQTPFAIQPNTVYTITFSARLNSGHPSERLYVDFIGDEYDSAQQEAWFDNATLSNKFQEINVDFYSGDSVPDQAYLRFFTFSDIPYEIKNVKLIQNASASSTSQLNKGSDLNPVKPLYNAVYESPDGISIYENPNFLPRARFVKKIRAVNKPAVATKILWNEDKFDPAITALVENYSGPTELENGELILADYSNTNAVNLTVRTGDSGFLVLSDSWYPGWKAYIDGQETKIYKTNAVSRGILITGAGEHTIEFRFVPKSFYLGLLITGITLAGFILYYFLIELRSRKNNLEGN